MSAIARRFAARSQPSTSVAAVEVLEAHIEKTADAPRLVVVQHDGVAVRGSSDILVIPDAEVAAAAAFIQQHAHRAIGVDDVAEATTISRRLLERRFKATTGRTLLEQIIVARIQRARRMLIETSLRVSDIAAACGFGSRAQLHRCFQKLTGVTPDEFRRNELS